MQHKAQSGDGMPFAKAGRTFCRGAFGRNAMRCEGSSRRLFILASLKAKHGVCELPRRTGAKRLRGASLLRAELAEAWFAESGAGEALTASG